MRFFKPTRWHIILTLLIFLVWFLLKASLGSFFGCALTFSSLPNLPDQPYVLLTPTPLQTIYYVLYESILLPTADCSRIAEKVLDLYTKNGLIQILSIILPIIISYLVSCILISVFPKHAAKINKK